MCECVCVPTERKSRECLDRNDVNSGTNGAAKSWLSRAFFPLTIRRRRRVVGLHPRSLTILASTLVDLFVARPDKQLGCLLTGYWLVTAGSSLLADDER
jgi:hypothetical protein